MFTLSTKTQDLLRVTLENLEEITNVDIDEHDPHEVIMQSIDAHIEHCENMLEIAGELIHGVHGDEKAFLEDSITELKNHITVSQENLATVSVSMESAVGSFVKGVIKTLLVGIGIIIGIVSVLIMAILIPIVALMGIAYKTINGIKNAATKSRGPVVVKVNETLHDAGSWDRNVFRLKNNVSDAQEAVKDLAGLFTTIKLEASKVKQVTQNSAHLVRKLSFPTDGVVLFDYAEGTVNKDSLRLIVHSPKKEVSWPTLSGLADDIERTENSFKQLKAKTEAALDYFKQIKATLEKTTAAEPDSDTKDALKHMGQHMHLVGLYLNVVSTCAHAVASDVRSVVLQVKHKYGEKKADKLHDASPTLHKDD